MTSFDGFQVIDAVLGKSLALAKTGLPTTQTPIRLTGDGPFTLTGDEFVTAMQTALIFTGGVTTNAITVTLPSTATILNVLNDLSASGNTQTYGAWTQLRVINQSTSQNVVLAGGDANTGITQFGAQAATSNVYTIVESLSTFSNFLVTVVQQVFQPQRIHPEYVTAQATTTRNVTGLNQIYTVIFDTLYSQSPTTNAVAYVLSPTNALVVQPGITVLISVTMSIMTLSVSSGNPTVSVAPAGQGASLVGLTGQLAGTISGMAVGTTQTHSLSVVYSNNTLSPTSWQVYITVFTDNGNSIIADGHVIPELTVTQIS